MEKREYYRRRLSFLKFKLGLRLEEAKRLASKWDEHKNRYKTVPYIFKVYTLMDNIKEGQDIFKAFMNGLEVGYDSYSIVPRPNFQDFQEKYLKNAGFN